MLILKATLLIPNFLLDLFFLIHSLWWHHEYKSCVKMWGIMIEIQHCLHNLSNPNIKSRLTSFNTFVIQNYILNIYFFSHYFRYGSRKLITQKCEFTFPHWWKGNSISRRKIPAAAIIAWILVLQWITPVHNTHSEDI